MSENFPTFKSALSSLKPKKKTLKIAFVFLFILFAVFLLMTLIGLKCSGIGFSNYRCSDVRGMFLSIGLISLFWPALIFKTDVGSLYSGIGLGLFSLLIDYVVILILVSLFVGRKMEEERGSDNLSKN